MKSRYAALDARGRERFDLRCWELRARGYSMEYVAAAQGCTVREAEGAVRRVACGRYGDVVGSARTDPLRNGRVEP